MYFPPEIIGAIIDQFHNDKTGLCVFSLVCRYCLTVTRHHLFEQVGLYYENTTDQFLDLLNSPLFTFGTYVRGLGLVLQQDVGWNNKVLRNLAVLKGVTRLYLMDLDWVSLEPDVQKGFFLQFKNLTAFELKYSQFESVSQAIGVLSSFRYLVVLSLCSVTFANDTHAGTPETTLCRSVPESLRFVELQRTSTACLLAWLLLQRPSPAVEDLVLYPKVGDTNPINNYIQSLGVSLKKIALNYGIVLLNENTLGCLTQSFISRDQSRLRY